MSRMAVVLVAAAGLAATCTPGPTAPAAPVASPVTPTTLDMGPIDVATYADVVPEPVTTTTTVAELVTVTTVAPRVRATTTTTEPAPMGERTVRGGVWGALADCESGGANVDTGNGYSGFFQFSDATFRSMGTGYSHAADAPYAVQLDAAQRLQARSGWGQWPACSQMLGLR